MRTCGILANRFGVRTFLFGAAVKELLSESEADTWQKARLQPDVLNCIEPLLKRSTGRGEIDEVPAGYAFSHHTVVSRRTPPVCQGDQRRPQEVSGPGQIFYDDDFKAQHARPSAHSH